MKHPFGPPPPPTPIMTREAAPLGPPPPPEFN